jgi:CHAD domain-containing protein
MIRRYARERASTLLRRLAYRMNRAAKLRDADSIHDLRVAIRRFEQCLQIFHQFFPGHKKIHRRLHKIMQLSGEVRNRDIALDLLKQGGQPARSALADQLRRERREFQGELMAAFDHWGERDVFRKWASKLEI